MDTMDWVGAIIGGLAGYYLVVHYMHSGKAF